MCGVVGFYSLETTTDDVELLWNLIIESRIRGVHAFGFAKVVDTGKVECKKYHDLFTGCNDKYTARNYLNNIKNNLIFHNRYSTSGDYKDHNNNQPVVINQTEALVFNGVISQATKEENQEKYKMELTTDNDGEIFLRQENKEEFLRKMKGSFAGLWVDKGEIYFARNSRRPLYFYIRGKGVFVASTKNIFERAGVLDLENVIEVEPLRIYKLRALCPE